MGEAYMLRIWLHGFDIETARKYHTASWSAKAPEADKGIPRDLQELCTSVFLAGARQPDDKPDPQPLAQMRLVNGQPSPLSAAELRGAAGILMDAANLAAEQHNAPGGHYGGENPTARFVTRTEALLLATALAELADLREGKVPTPAQDGLFGVPG